MKVYVDDEPIAEATRVHLNPGDVVVVTTPGWLSMAQPTNSRDASVNSSTVTGCSFSTTA